MCPMAFTKIPGVSKGIYPNSRCVQRHFSCRAAPLVPSMPKETLPGCRVTNHWWLSQGWQWDTVTCLSSPFYSHLSLSSFSHPVTSGPARTVPFPLHPKGMVHGLLSSCCPCSSREDSQDVLRATGKVNPHSPACNRMGGNLSMMILVVLTSLSFNYLIHSHLG